MEQPTTMDCPGCGKPGVSRALVACRLCWNQLPKHLRTEVYAHRTGTFGRVRAVAACRAWLKANARDIPTPFERQATAEDAARREFER